MLLARICLVTVTALWVTNSAAQPSTNPEDAAVYIEVHTESVDPTTNQPHLTKVAEGSGFLISQKGWLITAAHEF
jgi:hypothetical protein